MVDTITTRRSNEDLTSLSFGGSMIDVLFWKLTNQNNKDENELVFIVHLEIPSNWTTKILIGVLHWMIRRNSVISIKALLNTTTGKKQISP